MKKIKKFIKSPGVFFRDFFNKKYPRIYNEILCSQEEEEILIRHDISLEKLIDIDFPVDVVFTWVNDQDVNWQNKYCKYKNVNLSEIGINANDKARFENHNELYYSVRSVINYLPWVRNIYIVTDQQIPDWIGQYKKIIVVDHSDIIESKYLPTFNSHVIEANIHKINNLSEHFIYFNDDVFVARPLTIGHFFKANGLSSLFVSHKSLKLMLSKGVNTPTLKACGNSQKILFDSFKKNIDIPLVHTYVPLRKSIFEEIHSKYKKEINGFMHNKFRSDNDLNLCTFLVPWYTFFKGHAVQQRDICYYFNIRSSHAKKVYSELLKLPVAYRPHSLCANDVSTATKASFNYQQSLEKSLNQFFN